MQMWRRFTPGLLLTTTRLLVPSFQELTGKEEHQELRTDTGLAVSHFSPAELSSLILFKLHSQREFIICDHRQMKALRAAITANVFINVPKKLLASTLYEL